METKIRLSSKSKFLKRKINTEKYYLKIERVEVVAENNDKTKNQLNNSSINIKLIYKKRSFDNPLDLSFRYDAQKKAFVSQINSLQFNKNLLYSNNTKFNDIEYELVEENETDFEYEIYYSTIELEKTIYETFEHFKSHLDEHDNSKILFSAPFGHGKTTYLNEYFNYYSKEYEVFHLFPVNYCVAKNEDIFEFIKFEILFQLLGRDVDFDKEKFSYLETIPEFALKNAHKLLSTFLLNLPKIGKSAFDIYSKLYELSQKYFQYHDDLQIDDKQKAENFLAKFYEKEGSIYEDNFYTQLIRQLLEQLKLKSNKENVLIIDDMDRMDPEHIFRILNVFSAQFDRQDYIDGDTNKFGFDKIILVCDSENLNRIFCHRYGHKTDFSGYIDKYFSKQIYKYDNRKTIQSIIKMISNRFPDGDHQTYILKVILSDFNDANILSLREVIKIESKPIVNKYDGNDSSLFFHTCLFHLSFLSSIMSLESLVLKLKICSDFKIKSKNFNVNYEELSKMAFIPLTIDFATREKKQFKYKGENISILIENYGQLNNYQMYSPKKFEPSQDKLQLNASDFYLILIEIAKTYKSYLKEK